ncbi:hypothetical protein, partial [Klebsiella pneumoniae]|uniref:hypothetical protein n=1 Tax=Klebsiella pneumoniae TaxID=573 RepID=UPI003F5EC846
VGLRAISCGTPLRPLREDLQRIFTENAFLPQQLQRLLLSRRILHYIGIADSLIKVIPSLQDGKRIGKLRMVRSTQVTGY